ncbi:MAG: fibronectin type III domain-containing protein, partial [Candidatus Marsarchaeota archaeon]|nr:fibronectin type III domain-containing protein [Candidatus Marsarchaeota archaeon]
TVQLWQGSDSPGIAHITANSVLPTASGNIDVPIVCPIPQNLFATGVGTSKIAVYWDACPSATGYEVYRGTVAGGDKTILTGTSQPAFDGSTKMMFIDQTAVDDTTYYYVVKAVYSCGTSDASNEDDATTNSYAIPWDTRDATAIAQAAGQRVTVSANEFIVIGLDGTSYISGNSPLLPWPFDLGPTPELGNQGSESYMLASLTGYDPTKDADNLHNGPYGKDKEAEENYLKCMMC